MVPSFVQEGLGSILSTMSLDKLEQGQDDHGISDIVNCERGRKHTVQKVAPPQHEDQYLHPDHDQEHEWNSTNRPQKLT